MSSKMVYKRCASHIFSVKGGSACGNVAVIFPGVFLYWYNLAFTIVVPYLLRLAFLQNCFGDNFRPSGFLKICFNASFFPEVVDLSIFENIVCQKFLNWKRGYNFGQEGKEEIINRYRMRLATFLGAIFRGKNLRKIIQASFGMKI